MVSDYSQGSVKKKIEKKKVIFFASNFESEKLPECCWTMFFFHFQYAWFDEECMLH